MPEDDFKSIRITLSQEAFYRLERIMEDAKFRSNSSTIEECIRVVYDLMREIYVVAGARDAPDVSASELQRSDSWDRIIMRMARFTGRSLQPPEKGE